MTHLLTAIGIALAVAWLLMGSLTASQLIGRPKSFVDVLAYAYVATIWPWARV